MGCKLKSLFVKNDFDSLIKRIINLTADSPRQWGKLNICQMLLHCRRGLEAAEGTRITPQTFLGKILCVFLKQLATNDKPFRHGSPSPAGTISKETESFEIEKAKLIEKTEIFHSRGIEKCSSNSHAFFGRLTPTEWGSLMYKHIDHHLKQFGM